MGYDKLTNQIKSGKNLICKPFKKTHEEQLKLVTALDWIDFDKLRACEDEIRELLSQSGDYLDDERREAIIQSINSRIDIIESLSYTMYNYSDNIENDVDEDTAEDYTSEMKL